MTAERDQSADDAPVGGFEIVEEIPAYRGVRYGMNLVRERLPDGRIAERDIVRHPGAAVIVPLLDDGRVILVEQHRTPLGHDLFEIPAGVLEAGEDPAEAAVRELEEETGYRAAHLEKLFTFHPTPGFCDEAMHIFLGTGLTATRQDLDDDEFIEVHLVPLPEVRSRIARGEITDGKTLATFLHLFTFRPELLEVGGAR